MRRSWTPRSPRLRDHRPAHASGEARSGLRRPRAARRARARPSRASESIRADSCSSTAGPSSGMRTSWRTWIAAIQPLTPASGVRPSGVFRSTTRRRGRRLRASAGSFGGPLGARRVERRLHVRPDQARRAGRPERLRRVRRRAGPIRTKGHLDARLAFRARARARRDRRARPCPRALARQHLRRVRRVAQGRGVRERRAASLPATSATAIRSGTSSCLRLRQPTAMSISRSRSKSPARRSSSAGRSDERRIGILLRAATLLPADDDAAKAGLARERRLARWAARGERGASGAFMFGVGEAVELDDLSDYGAFGDGWVVYPRGSGHLDRGFAFRACPRARRYRRVAITSSRSRSAAFASGQTDRSRSRRW